MQFFYKWIAAYQAARVLGLVERPSGQRPRGKDASIACLEDLTDHLQMKLAVRKSLAPSWTKKKARAVTSLERNYFVSKPCLVAGISPSTSHYQNTIRFSPIQPDQILTLTFDRYFVKCLIRVFVLKVTDAFKQPKDQARPGFEL